MNFIIEVVESTGKIIVKQKWLININPTSTITDVIDNINEIDQSWKIAAYIGKLTTNPDKFVAIPLAAPISLMTQQGQGANMLRLIGSTVSDQPMEHAGEYILYMYPRPGRCLIPGLTAQAMRGY